ncbi:MAG: hypothetical protein B6241_08910 [Spirochaetaceae bacterium 4572_59]|nr:MAG: hypothetical protein B6241_08910 [Spirochaetaceae bacterium 4572_59]
MTLNELGDLILNKDNFIITAHEAPDGDAIGSEIVLQSILQYLHKNAIIINSDPTDHKYGFMDPKGIINHIRKDDPLPIKPEDYTLFVVDTEPGNIGHLGSRLNKDTVRDLLVIDHHDYKNGTPFQGIFISEASSTCEILYKLLKHFAIPFFNPLTEAMFAGIVYDTGSFIYPKTSAETFEIAHQLVLNGARPNFVYSELYESKSTESLKLRTLVGATMELHYSDHLAYQYMSKKMLVESGARYEESQEIVNIPLQCNAVRISVFVKENNEGVTRCSIRTKNEIDCLTLASRFGGGGHPTAAGFKITQAIDEVKKEILDFFAPYFNKK